MFAVSEDYSRIPKIDRKKRTAKSLKTHSGNIEELQIAKIEESQLVDGVKLSFSEMPIGRKEIWFCQPVRQRSMERPRKNSSGGVVKATSQYESTNNTSEMYFYNSCSSIYAWQWTRSAWIGDISTAASKAENEEYGEM